MALIGAQFVQAVQPVPVGSLQAYAGANAPTGWLLCDGTSYSTSVYPDLFSVLGYTYGGSGSNFRVPDLRGRMPIGAGNDGTAANNATRTLGDKGGDTRMQDHTHGLYGYDGVAYSGGAVGLMRNFFGSSSTGGATNAGGSAGNMPPFLVTNYIIKATSSIPRGGTALGSTPPIVTALPVNPQFGEVVTYIADAANGVAWNLQYDASGTYPWKFIGGAPYISSIDTSQYQTTTGAWMDMATVGPNYTVALPGDYWCRYELRGYNQTGIAATAAVGLSIGATNASFWNDFSVSTGFYVTTGGSHRFTGRSAGDDIRVRYYQYNSYWSWSNRRLEVTPVRVKAA